MLKLGNQHEIAETKKNQKNETVDYNLQRRDPENNNWANRIFVNLNWVLIESD